MAFPRGTHRPRFSRAAKRGQFSANSACSSPRRRPAVSAAKVTLAWACVPGYRVIARATRSKQGAIPCEQSRTESRNTNQVTTSAGVERAWPCRSSKAASVMGPPFRGVPAHLPVGEADRLGRSPAHSRWRGHGCDHLARTFGVPISMQRGMNPNQMVSMHRQRVSAKMLGCGASGANARRKGSGTGTHGEKRDKWRRNLPPSVERPGSLGSNHGRLG